MTEPLSRPAETVGPVLQAGETARALVQAIQAANQQSEIIDRGGYVRILVPGKCVLNRVDVERILGRQFLLPGDLEIIMPSFKGCLTVNENQAVWET